MERSPNLQPTDIADNRMSTAGSYQTANQDLPTPGVGVRSSMDELGLIPPTRPFSTADSAQRNSNAFSTAQTNSSFESTQLLAPGAPAFRDSVARESSSLLPFKDEAATTGFPPATDEPQPSTGKTAPAGSRKRFWLILAAILALLIVIAVAVAVPVALKRNNASSSASSEGNHGGSTGDGGSTSDGGAPTNGTSTEGPTTNAVVSGGDGSTITTEDGSTFTYSNKFGGTWFFDPQDPYKSDAQCNSWTKPLNESWDWANDLIRGVNLGGWLVPEPFIAPALFEPYLNASTPAVDEYTLSVNMAADTANGGLGQLEKHYQTFITEEDFAQIAGAGLNWIRLPIPFWAVQTFPGEPYLQGVSWKYVLKAFQWARKYGLRINLDLHAVPGSQNGYNHSGKHGQINFLVGTMGLANAQRTLDILRTITQFISQPEYANVVPMLGVINEALVSQIGMDTMTSFYLEMHDNLRAITGTGAGHGPYFSIHDGFTSMSGWASLLPGKDRFALDTHPYLIFGGSLNTDPLAEQTQIPCNNYASNINNSWTNFGVTTAGEWSLAVNDCGLWINGVDSRPRWEGQQGAGACDEWNDYKNWDATMKKGFHDLALSWMDATQHNFFWTWKIGPSLRTGEVMSPMWSYSLGLQNGWMPTDPRTAVGACGGGSPAGTLSPLQTGGAGAGQISASVKNQYPWPPSGLSGTVQYTQSAAITPLPTATFTGLKEGATQGGDGWFAKDDTTLLYAPISGCTYPDEYDPESGPSYSCSGSKRGVRGVVPRPRPT